MVTFLLPPLSHSSPPASRAQFQMASFFPTHSSHPLSMPTVLLPKQVSPHPHQTNQVSSIPAAQKVEINDEISLFLYKPVCTFPTLVFVDIITMFLLWWFNLKFWRPCEFSYFVDVWIQGCPTGGSQATCSPWGGDRADPGFLLGSCSPCCLSYCCIWGL